MIPPSPARTGRPVRFAVCLLVFAGCAALLFLDHIQYFSLPYFWDELGQFVPSALDILRDGAWVPHSAVPNAHPPGVMAYLALVWSVFAYSIPATRAAMLALASALVFVSFLLANRLSRGTSHTAAYLAILLLVADPLFHAQAMMAQLDMPAALFSTLALLLFLNDRQGWAIAVCTLLVLTKETGVVVPLIFAALLWRDRRRAAAAGYAVPFIALLAWFAYLRHVTGYLFGDSGFTHYNLAYPLNPIRIAVSLLRRGYYLFFADFRWIGSVAIWLAWSRARFFRSREWTVAGLAFLGQVLLVTVLGGAALERYLLPALPILYIAVAESWMGLTTRWRFLSAAAMTAGLILGWFLNPPFPFPYENNLAMTDFVRLQKDAAGYLEQHDARETVYTAWPFTAALRTPEFGYVRGRIKTSETSDLRASTLHRLSSQPVQVLVLYSRTWDPPWSVLRIPLVERFLERFYDYEPQLNASQARQWLGLERSARWERGGQWIEVYEHAGKQANRSGMPSTQEDSGRPSRPPSARPPQSVPFHRS